MTYIGFILVFIGLSFIFCGIIGLLKFSSFFFKVHASTIIDCCGIPLSILGLVFLQSNWHLSFKLVLVALLILLVNPLSTYTLTNASLFFKDDEDV